MSVRGLVLQKRDLDIIDYISKFPFASVVSIRDSFFPDSSKSAASRRVNKLFQQGLLHRLSPLSEHGYRYYVSKKSLQLAGMNITKTKRLQRHQLIHDIELYDFLRELRGKLSESERIIPDFELQQYAKRNYRQSFTYKGKIQTGELRFLPDALIKIGGKNVFLEWDRDTIHGINLYRKILAYGRFFQELKDTRINFDISNFRVLFICPDEKRCVNIAKIFDRHTTMSGIVTTATYLESFLFVGRLKN